MSTARKPRRRDAAQRKSRRVLAGGALLLAVGGAMVLAERQSHVPQQEDAEDGYFVVDPTGHATRSARAESEECYADLIGAACEDVWHRTEAALERRNPTMAEDALQEAFYYVCLQRSYRPPPLCGAFRMKAGALVVDSWRYERKFRDDPDAGEPACALPSPEEAALTQGELDLLDAALAKIDARSRKILELTYVGGLKNDAIAKRVGLSEGRVRAERSKALRKLAQILQRCR
jgi:RNA polymerase sigma factor (sigma-70 family)